MACLSFSRRIFVLMVRLPQSRKHIMNQPADVNAEVVKKALNPNMMQWSWVARNVLLRSSCTLGSPTAQVNCPAGPSIANVTAIKQAILELRTVNAPMPEGSTAVVGSGAAEGDLCVDKIGWSWTNVHVEDPDFIIVWCLLEGWFLGGVSEKRSGGADAGSADDAAAAPLAAPATLPARGGRPPPAPSGKGSKSGTKSGRGTKRTDPEPVVPNPSSVHSLRHKKAAAKYAKSLDVAASILLEQEARATVVRPPFVLGRVKPFSKWPFGGVVVFVQFPVLVDPTWRKTVTWTAYCRKVLILKTGGCYEIVFRPKKVSSASSADGPNGTEPLLDNRDMTNAAFGAGMDASGAAAAGTDASGEGPSGGGESGTDQPSGGVGTGAAADGTHADASENDELGTLERIEESLLPGSGAGAASVGRSVSPSAAGGLVDGASTGAPVNGEAELAVETSHGQLAPGAGGGATLTGDNDAATAAEGSPPDSWVGSEFTVADLFDAGSVNDEEPAYSPLPETLQEHFIATLEKSKVWGAPDEDEQIELSVVSLSAPSSFSLVCTFASSMDLGRSQSPPCGSHRSNNFVTCAYPVRDPRDEQEMELR